MNKFDKTVREQIESELFPLLVTHLTKEFEELAISEGKIRSAVDKFAGRQSFNRRDGVLILVRNYTDAADGLFGNTYEYISVTSSFVGSRTNPSGFARFNKFLRYGSGLVFNKNRTAEVVEKLEEASVKFIEVDAEDPSTFDKIPEEKFVPGVQRERPNRRPNSRPASRAASPVAKRRDPPQKAQTKPKQLKSWADEMDSSEEEEVPRKSSKPTKKAPIKPKKTPTKTTPKSSKKRPVESSSDDEDSD